MFKFKKLVTKPTKPDAGFTLLELLVATLVAFFFVVGSMQALVLATMLRVKAQSQQRANQLIQEDIEEVQSIAQLTSLGENHEKCFANSYSNGYAQLLWDEAQNGYTTKTIKLTDNNNSQEYQLIRTKVTTGSESPHRVLKIKYEVKETGSNGKTIATDYIEVIPDAALRCP